MTADLLTRMRLCADKWTGGTVDRRTRASHAWADDAAGLLAEASALLQALQPASAPAGDGALLRDIASSGVEYDDARLDYVTVQIDRVTWDAVRALSAPAAVATTAKAERLSDEHLTEFWRRVSGPAAALNGPLLRFAGLIQDYVAANSLTLSLHRCKVCGTAWLLWPDGFQGVDGAIWNLLDKYQRPGACCDNAAMGDQIEHLRDIPLTVAHVPSVPPADESSMTGRVACERVHERLSAIAAICRDGSRELDRMAVLDAVEAAGSLVQNLGALVLTYERLLVPPAGGEARTAEDWQPIATADADTPVLLWTPRERLTDLPEHIAPEIKPDMRVSAPRHWTWATHWMPLPAAPSVPTPEAGARQS